MPHLGTVSHLALLVDKEFGEVPLDGVDDGPVLLLLQEVPQGMGLLAVHIDFGVQVGVEVPLAVDELLDLLVGARLLVVKLQIQNSLFKIYIKFTIKGIYSTYPTLPVNILFIRLI
jgi:hypothetical protein